MTDQKLSQLTNITSLSDTDEYYVNDAGTSKAVNHSVLRDAIRNDDPIGGVLGLNGGEWQAFMLRIQNTAGTLQHNFRNLSKDVSTSFVSGINGASSTLQNTPSGNDATTNFTAGVKISSASNQRLILESADLTSGASLNLLGTMRYQDIGTLVQMFVSTISLNVNGTTRNWLFIDTYNATTGASFNLNTTNIPSGKQLQFQLMGFMPPYS